MSQSTVVYYDPNAKQPTQYDNTDGQAKEDANTKAKARAEKARIKEEKAKARAEKARIREEKVPDKTQIKRLVIPQKKKTMRTHQGLLSQMTSHWIHGGSTLSMKGGKSCNRRA